MSEMTEVLVRLVAADPLSALLVRLQAEGESMRSRDGLHPYRAGLFFILRNHNTRTSRQRRAALTAGDVGNISHWEIVCLLATAFGKSGREVARDLIETYHTLEDGQPAP